MGGLRLGWRQVNQAGLGRFIQEAHHHVDEIKAPLADMRNDQLRDVALTEVDMKVCWCWNGDGHCRVAYKYDEVRVLESGEI